MDFALTEEQQLLAETARRFLEDKMPSERVRELMESEEGYDADLWKEIGALGWQAMAIPEQYGGAGYSAIEQSVLLEEMGRALLPAPYLSSAVLVANVILEAGTEEQKQAILPPIAAGDETGALAFTEPEGRWDAEGIAMPARPDGDEFVLSGSKMFVVRTMARRHAQIAQANVQALSLPAAALIQKLHDDPEVMRDLQAISLDGRFGLVELVAAAARALPQVMNAERLARGLPTEHTQISGTVVGGGVLSIDELVEVGRILAEVGVVPLGDEATAEAE